MSDLAFPGLAVALLWATLSDLLYRRIQNGLILLLLLVWGGALGYAVLAGRMTGPDAAASALTAVPGALAVLVVGFVLFRLGRVGAGDVKLTAVLCLWLGAPHQVTFLIAMSLAGGVLALSLPVLRQVEHAVASLWLSLARMTSVPVAPPQCLDTSQARQGIPYAIAITIGAAGTILAHHPL